MTTPANIIRVSLSGTGTYCVQGGVGVGRIVLRVSATTRLAMFEGYLSSQYITLPAGTIMVLDPPNLLAEEDLWFQLDAGGTGVLEVLRC
jgi:hypothetical protein